MTTGATTSLHTLSLLKQLNLPRPEDVTDPSSTGFESDQSPPSSLSSASSEDEGASLTSLSSDEGSTSRAIQLPSASGSSVPTGQSSRGPTHPGYSLREKRRASFVNWPRHAFSNVEALVDAGLFYEGEDDMAICYYCGGALRSWQKDDIPFVEHARWYPECTFVKLSMEPALYNTVRSLQEECLMEEPQHLTKGTAVGYVEQLQASAAITAISEEPSPSQSNSTPPSHLDVDLELYALERRRLV
ncbi:baculoviral IAP repeat-containing protein 7-B [Ixodes scapularis]